MSQENKYIINQASLKTLPEFALLQKNYPQDEWLVIGTLTHAKPTSMATQLFRFRTMLHALGKPNNTFGSRLHWVVRVGGGEETDRHTHLHFLISRHQLTNGNRYCYKPEQVIHFIKDHWTQYGMIEHQDVQHFDSSRNGISYVLREEAGEQMRWVEMSESLWKLIKNRQKSSALYIGRDPSVVEMIRSMRANGAVVGFGDEIKELRVMAAAR